MTVVDKSTLFHVMGDTLSKTQPAKIDLSDSPLWHRWLRPLWAVEQTLPAVFNYEEIASELVVLGRSDAPSYG